MIFRLLLLAGLAFHASAAITIGNVSTATGNTSTLTQSHNNNGDYLIVDVAGDYDGGETVAGVTFNGVALTKLAEAADGGGYGRDITRWRLIAPASGSHDVVVSLSTPFYVVVSIRSFLGVHQTTAEGTTATASGNSGSTPTVDASSAAGELVVDALNFLTVISATTITVGPSQTQDVNTPSAAGNIIGTSHEAGASTVTMSWSYSAGNPWAIIATPLKPAPTTTTRRRVIIAQ